VGVKGEELREDEGVERVVELFLFTKKENGKSCE